MIVVSLLLILVSGGLLAAGILQANDPLVMASIGVSVLAAAALFLGIRQQGSTAQQDGAAERATDAAAPPRRDERVPAGAPSQGLAGALEAGAGRVPAATGPGPEIPARGLPPRDVPVPASGTATVPTPPSVSPPAAAASAAATGMAAVGAPGQREQEQTAAAEPPGRLDAAEVAETQVIDVGKIPAEATTPDADAYRADVETERATVGARDGGGMVPADTERAGEAGPDAAAAEPAGDDAGDLVDDEEDPPDEPIAELLMASEVNRLSNMDSEVLVVDGRPRYHLNGCPHLEDKDSQPLPVSEAIELGFSACSLCSAATALLTESPRE